MELKEKEQLHTTFCQITGYKVPKDYFLDADCYGLKKHGKYIAGFILKRGTLPKLRSYQEIPIEERAAIDDKYFDHTADLTGYFITDRRYGLRFTAYMVLIVALYRTRYFIYSYDVDNLRLKKYYGHGKPTLLYSGPPALVAGYSEQQPDVNVEVLTKMGVLRIFIQRTKKLVKLSWHKAF